MTVMFAVEVRFRGQSEWWSDTMDDRPEFARAQADRLLGRGDCTAVRVREMELVDRKWLPRGPVDERRRGGAWISVGATVAP